MRLIIVLYILTVSLVYLFSIQPAHASPFYFIRLYSKPDWTGITIQKNFHLGQCSQSSPFPRFTTISSSHSQQTTYADTLLENWSPAVGAYVRSAATQVPSIVCHVYTK